MTRIGGILLSTLVSRVVGLSAKATALKSMPEHENARNGGVQPMQPGGENIARYGGIHGYIELGQGFRYVQST